MSDAPDDPLVKRPTVRFDRLRLDGFKSFADRTELLIEPGLTGVVGPNGCGKSNLLEALRWVLGETSARRMRGEGMDDIIFGGSDRRPARNVAEVGVVLDNRARAVPPEFNEEDYLDISRRIERGQGADYRVNGRGARLRDIQILFRDNASGATSPAIVSQGRVGALISMKPGERRVVLEDAAGVSGLSARRHDTELRLKATHQNLERAQDALTQSSDLLANLRRQARQVQRRREIDGLVRQALAAMLLARHSEAARNDAQARAAHEANEQRVATAMLGVNAAVRDREEVSSVLGPLLEARVAAETAAALAQSKFETIRTEAERTARELQEAERRLMEIAVDRQREDQAIQESERELRRLLEERMEIVGRRSGQDEAMEQASDAVDAARRVMEQSDTEAQALAAELAAREANRQSALKAKGEAERRVAAIEARLKDAEARLAESRARMPADDALEQAAEQAAVAEEILAEATQRSEAAEAGLSRARERAEAAQSELAAAVGALTRCRAERDGLAAAARGDGSKNPVSLRLSVEPGWEAAVAAAFGDSLSAGCDPTEETWWAAGSSAAPDPSGAPTLAERLAGVPELEEAARAALVVDDLDRILLVPGQTAVTQAGAFRRWDGLRGTGAKSVASDLVRTNRLRELDALAATLEVRLHSCRQNEAAAKASLELARREDEESRSRARLAFDEVRKARDALSAVQRQGEALRRQLAVDEAAVASIRAERQEALRALSEASDALASIPADEEARERATAARRRLEAAREAESAAKLALERLISDTNQRDRRFADVLRQEQQWSARLAEAKARREALSERDEEAHRLLAEIAERPSTPQQALEEATVAAEEAVAKALAAAKAQEDAERKRDAAETALRTSESALAAAREERARLLGAIEAAQAHLRGVEASVSERIGVSPADLPAAAGLADAAGLDIQACEAKLTRLERERETLGAVNFLAETELLEQQKRYDDIVKGKEELTQTVDRLSKAIKEIEREARAKLEDAFRRIDSNFADLFSRLFGGGQAHLRLVGSEDILEAGLEIYASPPGKRMQVLSLLSGGEQALTAMALIFAAFQINPAPICVLDEADAPLDDANADRLCRLIEAMALRDATRFLVVTHNPLTMARMNRLYGVTMGERGVSSLTKVDLDKAIDIGVQVA